MTPRSSRRRRSALTAVSTLWLALTACASGSELAGTPVFAPTRAVKGSVTPTPQSQVVRLGDVQFVTREDGFLVRCTEVGDRCPTELFGTRDAGATWNLVSRSAPAFFDFVSARNGVGLDGGCRRGTCYARISITGDRGRTWSHLRTVSFRPRRGVFGAGSALSFVDPAHGWFALGGHLFRTADGGITWTELGFVCARSLGSMSGMSFGTVTTGYVGCEGEPATDMASKTLFRTNDGGTTWHVVSSIAMEGMGLRDVGLIPAVGYGMWFRFVSANRGFLMAGRLGIERTIDGGRHFRPLWITDDVDDVAGTSWLSPSLGYVALCQGGLVRTTDGGSTWTALGP